ncbi:hypothetical protein [Acidihalobacter ferrooxydans]|uniref:Uncharacterized protein n=1 Tax=Acidihalobacter ferrooxydans TaxID=1765967 RepID=A0A1P8UJ58_9GAMM|nr:hypothetical protein [Acidihalobacter ferrooxydans]APZ43844.1 hypothetical protein BW247_12705 [Acidihalobacter ferrooxydans]
MASEDCTQIEFTQEGDYWLAFDDVGNCGEGKTKAEARRDLRGQQARNAAEVETFIARREHEAEQSKAKAEAERKRQFDANLGRYLRAIGKLERRINRRVQNGTAQRESDRRKIIADELEGFAYDYPPIETTPQAPGWLEQSTVKIVPPTSTQVADWRKSVKKAANAHRQAAKNREKQPAATRAAIKAKHLATERKKKAVRALAAQGKTNRQIASVLGLRPRQVQRLKK